MGNVIWYNTRKTGKEGLLVQKPIRILLYAAAAVLIVLGVMRGEAQDVLIKAVKICTECIGLG